MFLPSRLVFCGGGTRCLVFLQTLVELEKHNHLVNVKEYWGTSAGALLASLLAISKSAQTVKKVMFAADYTKFRNIDVSNMLMINTTWGLDDGTSLTGEIERLFDIVEPGSKTLKMSDIRGLNIVLSNLNTHETVVCSGENYPDMRVIDAIRASMSLPIMFRPYRHPQSGHYWVDGAVRANFPWDMLPDDKARSEALGFTFEKSWADGPKTFMEYLFSMIHFDEPKKMAEQKQAWPKNIIWYPSPPFPAWYVNFKEDDYKLVEQYGQTAADMWWSVITQAPCQETLGSPPVCDPPHIPLQPSPLDRVSELLGTQKLLQTQGSASLLKTLSPLSSRRWSV